MLKIGVCFTRLAIDCLRIPVHQGEKNREIKGEKNRTSGQQVAIWPVRGAKGPGGLRTITWVCLRIQKVATLRAGHICHNFAPFCSVRIFDALSALAKILPELTARSKMCSKTGSSAVVAKKKTATTSIFVQTHSVSTFARHCYIPCIKKKGARVLTFLCK